MIAPSRDSKPSTAPLARFGGGRDSSVEVRGRLCLVVIGGGEKRVCQDGGGRYSVKGEDSASEVLSLDLSGMAP